MASNHAVLFKKLEEIEAQVRTHLQSPTEIPLNDLKLYQIRRKVDFIKTLLAAETGSGSGDGKRPGDLQEIAGRISAIERNFFDWAIPGAGGAELSPGGEPKIHEEIAERLSFIENNFEGFDSSETGDGTVDGPAPPISCRFCHDDDDQRGDEDEDDTKAAVVGVTEERIREELEAIVSRVDIEKIVKELMVERGKEKEKRQGGRWLRRLGTMGAAAVVAAVGLAIAGFGSVEESVYLVPT